MANYIIDGTLLTNIAAAIRSKRGGTNTYTPAQMATAINELTAVVDDGTTYSLNIYTALGDTIPAESSKWYLLEMHTGGATTALDLRRNVIVGGTVSCFSSGTAAITGVDVDANRVRIAAFGSGSVTIASANVMYRKIVID